MTTLLLTHESYLAHNTGPYHPEQPARLSSILKGLDQPIFSGLIRENSPRASEHDISRAHPGAYTKRLLSVIPSKGLRQLDSDTIISSGSAEAVFRAAGAVIRAIDAVAAREVDNAFCAIRPPGHHAEADQAMGFCLVNNVAVGAFHARAVQGYRRVAVIDFDVHHGNGTQKIFWNDAETFYASTHQFPFYPGTGNSGERGAHNNVLNVPLLEGSCGEVFRGALAEEILPAVAKFKPDIILISAGFDAHKDDPLGGLCLAETDFAWATAAIMDMASEVCSGRVVSVLEGGYNLVALTDCVVAHVETLKDH
ncbi:MAG TPA: acetoin utilization protein [Rhodospirillaceae bacterium]|nr:acetoin utilization protein [Candidatus Neomarinimicrobiota bacterium]HCX14254.1 acetoin utilization protein [Rhodospirillaceae bacterium]